MGIRFTRNTWRAPLQLIDCWLPADPQPLPAARQAGKVVQLFARAGWLQPGSTRPDSAPPTGGAATVHRLDSARPRNVVRVRRGRDGEAARAGTDTRVVIAGRMADVCAELDRLVALESQRAA